MASSRIMSTLQTHSACFTESGFMLKIKNLMLLFSHTLQGYGFSAEKMYGLLQELRDHYNEVLMQKWVIRFRDIFDSDNYHPIQVSMKGGSCYLCVFILGSTQTKYNISTLFLVG